MTTTPTKKKRVSIFKIGTYDPQEILHILETEDTFLHAKRSAPLNLLKIIARCCLVNNTDTVTTSDIEDMGEISASSISVYAGKLVNEFGYLRKQRLRKTDENAGRPPMEYILNDLRLYIKDIPDENENSELEIAELKGRAANKQTELFDSNEAPIIDIEESGYYLPNIVPTHKAEIFSTFTLLSALRIGTHGQRSESFTTPIHIGSEHLRVKVSAVEGEKIAGIMDTKALIAISSLAIDFYGKQKQPRDKPLRIDTNLLCSIMGRSNDGGNRKAIWDSVNAWRQTQFKIISATQGISEKFGDELIELSDFSFIANLRTLIETKTSVPRAFAVWLEPTFLERLLDKENRFVVNVHSQIMREKSAGRLLMYYWCRRAIQYNINSFQQWTFEHLRREVAYHMTDSNFRKMIQKFITSSDKENRVYSYLIKCDTDLNSKNYKDAVFRIHADPKDELVKLYYRKQTLPDPE